MSNLVITLDETEYFVEVKELSNLEVLYRNFCKKVDSITEEAVKNLDCFRAMQKQEIECYKIQNDLNRPAFGLGGIGSGLGHLHSQGAMAAQRQHMAEDVARRYAEAIGQQQYSFGPGGALSGIAGQAAAANPLGL